MHALFSRSARLLSFALLAAATASVASPNPEEYPLHLRILNLHTTRERIGSRDMRDYEYKGEGRATLTDGDKVNGADFTFECSDEFLSSSGSESYPAKWKKQGLSVVILIGVIGKDKTHTCELKVQLKDFVYIRQNGNLVTISQEEYHQRLQGAHQFAMEQKPEDADVTHYPLELALLAVDWEPRSATGFHGTGQGNLKQDGKTEAVDFTIACPTKIMLTPEGRFYHAQWQKKGTDMAVLTKKIGESAYSNVCELKTSVREDVYIRQAAGSLAALSQTQYQAYLKAQPATP